MKAYGYLLVFLVTFFVLPLLYSAFLAPYGTASFWPLLLVFSAMLPLLARFLSVAFGNRAAGYSGGKLAKALLYQTLIYYVVLFGVTLAIIYFFLGGF